MRALPMILLAALCATSAQARQKEVLSWGKAGVSFDAYRSDAATCGRQGYYLDIADTQAVTTLKAATRQLDANEAALQSAAMTGELSRVMDITASSAHIVEGARPDQRFAELRTMMTDKVAACLSQLGYTQFRLTPAQRSKLKHLKQGSPERHAYLHALGSNPMVLANQAV